MQKEAHEVQRDASAIPPVAARNRLHVAKLEAYQRVELLSRSYRSGHTGVIKNFDKVSRSLRDFNTIQEDLVINDLKLLRHYTTKTYATLDFADDQQDIWRDAMVQIGFRHPFLLRGVLAISALHLATLQLNLSSDLVVQASSHYNKALVSVIVARVRPDSRGYTLA